MLSLRVPLGDGCLVTLKKFNQSLGRMSTRWDLRIQGSLRFLPLKIVDLHRFFLLSKREMHHSPTVRMGVYYLTNYPNHKSTHTN